MPMVIPVIAAFAAGASGVAALGAAAAMTGIAGTVATIAAYATIAGAVLTGVGALTGSKDLMKIGAVLAIGGGLTSLATGAIAGSSAAAGAAEGAANATGAAADAGGAAELFDATGGLETASNYVHTPSVGAATAPGAIPSPNATAPTVAAPTPTPTAPTAAIPNEALVSPDAAASAYQNLENTQAALGGGGNSIMDKVSMGGKQFNAADLNAWWQKAQDVGGAVGKFVENNKGLVKVGTDMLASAYGPEAEEIEWKKSIYNRQTRNLNTPIKLTYTRTGGG